MPNYIAQWAGWNRTGYRSDAIWAAAYASDGTFEYRYGARTTSHRTGSKTFASEQDARAHFEKMVREKTDEGYAPIGFQEQMTSVPAWGGATLSSGDGASAVGVGSSRALLQVVQSIGWMELQERQWVDDYGVVEMVDGNAVTISSDGVGGLAAYGPSGREVKLPGLAAVVGRMGRVTVEGFLGRRGKELVLTDIRESGDRLFLDDSYRTRRDALAEAMKTGGLAAGVAPTLAEARELAGISPVVGLGAEEDGVRFGNAVNRVFAEGGKGVITTWMGPAPVGGTASAVGRFEFYTRTQCLLLDLDERGMAGLGLMVGGAHVRVGSALSSFTPEDAREIHAKLATGVRQSVAVRHLQVADDGIGLVDASIEALNEVDPAECVLKQLPRDRQESLAAYAQFEV
ncbi:MAG: WGR domain-containing protein [Candidatus Dormibacteria bacterium]